MTQIGLFTLCIILYALPDKWYDQWSLTPGCVLNSFTFNLMLWTICTYLSVLTLVNWTTEAPLSPKGLGQTVAYIRHARLVESTQICDECVWESALVPFQQPKLAHVLFTEPDCQPKLARFGLLRSCHIWPGSQIWVRTNPYIWTYNWVLKQVTISLIQMVTWVEIQWSHDRWSLSCISDAVCAVIRDNLVILDVGFMEDVIKYLSKDMDNVL